MTRPPVRPVSLQDLRRIAETLAAVHGVGAVMRSTAAAPVEMADGSSW